MGRPFPTRQRPPHGLLGPEPEVRFTAHEDFETAVTTELAVRRSEVKAYEDGLRQAYAGMEAFPEARAVLTLYFPKLGRA